MANHRLCCIMFFSPGTTVSRPPPPLNTASHVPETTQLGNMEKLETYNRVPALESQRIRRILVVCYVINVMALIACVIGYWIVKQPLPYALLGVAISLIAGFLLINYDNHRQKTCRFCGNGLSFVVRPLVLNQQYLSMDGKKVGNHFYTLKKAGLLGRLRWSKLSNQALVCHNCRLSETTHRIVQETPSEGEIRQLELS